jgi:DNA-binding transcriptional LysR family regulator
MMTDYDGLALLVRIAEAGSLSGAARALGLPKSTVSRRLDQLEAGLGAPLLHRSTRRLALTDVGRMAVERAKPWVEDADALYAEIAGANAKPSGLIRLGATAGFAQGVLGPPVCAFLQDHPQVRISLVLSEGRADVIGEGLDLVVRMGALPDSELVARRLARVTRLLVAAPAYLKARGNPETPESLKDYDCIVTSPALDGWDFADGPSIRVPWRLAAGTIAMAREAALGGHGVALLPRFLVADDLAAGRLVQVLPDHPLPSADATALTPRDRTPSIAVRALVQHLAKEIGGKEL